VQKSSAGLRFAFLRILIVGGGGLGTVLAGYLSRSGEDVSLLVKEAQAQSFERELVRIEGAELFAAPITLLSAPPKGSRFDYLILCVKSRDTEAAMRPLAEVEVAVAVSLQNGVAKDGALSGYLGKDRVIGGVTYVAGALIAPGHARVSNPAASEFGELNGSTSERTRALSDAFSKAGLPAKSVPDIMSLEWYKLTIFLRTALVSALTRLDLGRLTLHASLRNICASVAHEVVEVAMAEGHKVPRHASSDFSLAGPARAGQSSLAIDAGRAEMQEVLDRLGEYLRKTERSFYPSLAQDIMAGRPTELQATAGDVLARADRQGLEVPALRVCTELLRGITQERGQD
jgi:2-dehydropantoate 2-reductase